MNCRGSKKKKRGKFFFTKSYFSDLNPDLNPRVDSFNHPRGDSFNPRGDSFNPRGDSFNPWG